MKYRVTIRCTYCMDDIQDSMGCNDGIPWSIDEFNTEAEAKAAGEKECEDCGPWYYIINSKV